MREATCLANRLDVEPAPVVGDPQDDTVLADADEHVHGLGVGVLHGVGDQLGRQEVGVCLVLPIEAWERVGVAVHPHGQRGAAGQAEQGPRQPPVPQDRREDVLRGVAQPRDDPVDLLGELRRDRLDLRRVALDGGLGETDPEPEHHQLLLDAVVQVRRQPATLLVASAGDPLRARAQRPRLAGDQIELRS